MDRGPRRLRSCTVAVAMLSMAAVGCAGGERGEIAAKDLAAARAPSTANRSVRGGRRFLEASWDTVFIVGGSLSDTLLLRPRILAAGREGPVVFDYGDHAVNGFDTAGRPRRGPWSRAPPRAERQPARA